MEEFDNPETEIVQRHIDQLLEHFDTVHVFCTRHEPDKGTFNISRGDGNFFARFGQISEWITQSNEQTKMSVRTDEENDD